EPESGARGLMDPDTTPPVIAPGYTFSSVTDKISSIVLARRTPLGWYAGFGITFLLTMLLLVSLGYLVVKGIGIWGNNQPVAWAFDITNFVWWIGIGHAGTLISAILLLLRQAWRTSINRFAEAMTLFAVACAGIFPLFHTGRPWLAHADLSAVLRRRRHLLRVRDGADARDSDPRGLPARRLHHVASPAEHGEGDARHRAHRRLRLSDGSVHRVVQHRRVRRLRADQPPDRSVRDRV